MIKKKIDKKTQYRWVICAMLFFAVAINYLDRQVLSLTWPKYIGPEFGWNNEDYGNITAWFSLFYALCMLFAGRFVDWLGTKKGFLWAIGLWSVGACLHSCCPLITSGIVSKVWSISFNNARDMITVLKKNQAKSIAFVSVITFIYARFVLALGESGNFPASIKAIAEYFPQKDRAFATSIFNSGATIGAMIAPSLILGITALCNWEITFMIIGIFGFIWMVFWIFLYKKPEFNPNVNLAELKYIQQDNMIDIKYQKQKKLSFIYCCLCKQTWAFAIGKFMTDGVWWFYLFWMPKYLQTVFGLEGKAQIFPLTILYTIVLLSIIGGWLPLFFIEKRGMNPYAGKMKAMLIFAFIPLITLAVQSFGEYSHWILPICLIGIVCAAHQAWSANIFSIIGDMFPKNAIATITGIGGMAGGIGSFIIQKTAGELFDYAGMSQMIFWKFKGESAGYFIIFCLCSTVYLIGWLIIRWLVPPKHELISSI